MTQKIVIRVAQINAEVGNISANLQHIESICRAARADRVDIVLTPELSLIGYPPEDLLLRPALHQKLINATDSLKAMSHGIMLCVGVPSAILFDSSDHGSGNETAAPPLLHNSLATFSNGELISVYHKQCLPNYQVFDERRYFEPGREPCIVSINGRNIGMLICEDVWVPSIVDSTCARDVDCIFVANASPFAENKMEERLAQIADRSKTNDVPIVYANLVGGQDELIFDGGSFATNRSGKRIAQAAWFEPDTIDLSLQNGDLTSSDFKPTPSRDELLYKALVTGVQDYFYKTGFQKAVLGLSGGIDSALTLAIAVDALGAKNVHAVMMPYIYTAEMSVADAQRQAKTLACKFSIATIKPMVQEFLKVLSPFFEGHPTDSTEENLQSRCRGVLLMALSNKTGALVLTTGNKSEMSVGYATLYGDMAGGYSVLKDVWKTRVYDLARFVNSEQEIIPERVIVRPPSAELAPNQKDLDSLPPYEILDAILTKYIHADLSRDDIITQGFDAETVNNICRLVDINEYKRRQAPVGPRLTIRGFGRDRRYPIANGWAP